jgi:hypothetical protein
MVDVFQGVRFLLCHTLSNDIQEIRSALQKLRAADFEAEALPGVTSGHINVKITAQISWIFC